MVNDSEANSTSNATLPDANLKTELLEKHSANVGSKQKELLFRVLPITRWLSEYSMSKLQYDFNAGITVGIMAIPQSMAYAMLAGLPPQYGLYCCLVPLIVYGILGTCGQVTIGPCAIISMMCGSALSFLNPDTDLNDYVGAMMTLSFFSGSILLLLGLLRMGFVAFILSQTVITSFTAASAFNIAASQLKHLWGVSTNKDSFIMILFDIFSPNSIKQFNWYATIVGVSCMILLYLMKLANSKYLAKYPLPVELFLIILCVFVSWFFNLHDRWNLKTMQDYPVVRGLAPISIPSMKYLHHTLPQGIMIGLVAYAITISMGKTFSTKNKYRVDENQELIALGSCSFIGSFFSAFPSTGSLSRSSLINNMGSKTPVNTLITPLVIAFCLFFLMDCIKYIPNACLAAIVIINLFSLFKRFGELKPLWRTMKEDFWTFVVCASVTMILGTQYGLLSGIGMSFITMVIGRTMQSKMIPTDLVPLSVASDVVVVDAKQSVDYLSCRVIERQVENALHTEEIQRCVVDLRYVKYIDATGAETLSILMEKFNTESKRLCLLVENDYIAQRAESLGSSLSKTISFEQIEDAQVQISVQ